MGLTWLQLTVYTEDMIVTVTREQLRPYLLEPKAPGLVKEPYFIIKGEDDEQIIALTPGKNGNEFNKTIGYFHKHQGVISYHITHGQGVILMQRNDSEGESKEVRVVGLRIGTTVEVPAGYGHFLANVGKNYLIAVASGVPSDKLLSTELIDNKRGFAYYLVDKKGDVGFESNHNYKLHPQITTG